MINKDGLRKMLRDLRVLDFLKQQLEIYMNESATCLCLEKWDKKDGETYEINIYDIPDYIKDDLYEWVMDDEI